MGVRGVVREGGWVERRMARFSRERTDLMERVRCETARDVRLGCGSSGCQLADARAELTRMKLGRSCSTKR